jgi:hypothetical protein
MEYKINIDNRGEIQVDSLEYGINAEGSTEGWGEIYIRVEDVEKDIYTNQSKRVWIEWLDANCGEKHNPEERILPVVATIYGDDETPYRSITIEEAYLSHYVEHSMGAYFSYVAEIRRAPTRKGDIKISDGA